MRNPCCSGKIFRHGSSKIPPICEGIVRCGPIVEKSERIAALWPQDATVARFAPVAQGIERAPPERKAVGSIPTGRTRFTGRKCCITQDSSVLSGHASESTEVREGPHLGCWVVPNRYHFPPPAILWSRRWARDGGRCPLSQPRASVRAPSFQRVTIRSPAASSQRSSLRTETCVEKVESSRASQAERVGRARWNEESDQCERG